MMDAIHFWVPGLPATKGSARAFIAGKRAIITNDNKRAKPWASLITMLARDAMAGRAPIEGPVSVEIVFYLPRPKAHRRASGAVKASAPEHVITKPDGDKMLRCAWDALTGVVFVDDAQIVAWPGGKRYADEGRIGAAFMIAALDGTRAEASATLTQPQLVLGVAEGVAA